MNTRRVCLCWLVFTLLLFSTLETPSLTAQPDSTGWTQVGFSGIGINAIAVAPSNPQVVYAASSQISTSGGVGVFRSNEGGAAGSWFPIRTGLPTFAAVTSLAINRQNPDIIYASTLDVGTHTEGGIFKSDTGGASWSRVLTGNNFWRVTIDPQYQNVIYALDGYFYGNHVYMSREAGAGGTWLATGDAGLAAFDPTNIIVDPTNSDILYVTSGRDGVYKSTDGANHWFPANTGLSRSYINDLVIHPQHSEILYTGARSAGGAFESTNGGQSWTAIPTGLDNAWVETITINPSNPSSLYVGAYRQPSTGTVSSGVFALVTAEGERRWEALNDGFPTPGLPLVRTLVISPDSQTIFAGTSNGLWKRPLNQSPRAAFTSHIREDNTRRQIEFADESTGDITTYLWDFGDSTTSTERNPIHTYSAVGTYTVTLTVSGPFGSESVSHDVVTGCVLNFTPQFTQNDSIANEWHDDLYGGMYVERNGQEVLIPFRRNELLHVTPTGTDLISDWGCALTSYAMVINYAAEQQGKTFRPDPGIMNDYLQRHAGYTVGSIQRSPILGEYVMSSLVDPTAVERYAADRGIALTINSSSTNSTRADINNQLCAFRPVMLNVNNRNHFVLATGQTRTNDRDTWRLQDPLYSEPTTLVQNYGDSYNAVRTFTMGTVPPHSLTIAAHSPVALIITDPLGRRTGFDPRTNTSLDEIPESGYWTEYLGLAGGTGPELDVEMFTVRAPLDGIYAVDVVGTGYGEYSLEFITVDNSGQTNRRVISGIAAEAASQEYRLSYNSIDSDTSMLIQVVQIDVLPNLDPNVLVLSDQGILPVAILSDSVFDATTIDPSTVRLAGSLSTGSSVEDINGNGFEDLVVNFPTQDLQLTESDTQAILEGLTFAGLDIWGEDSIQVIKNLPPVLNVAQAIVVGDEGQLIINDGTFQDANGDSVMLGATIGTVTNNADNTWTWNFSSVDGPVESQQVTVYADDRQGGTSEVTFELVVYNAVPIVNAGQDAALYSGQFFVVGASFVDAGILDTHTATVDAGLGYIPQPAPVIQGTGFGTVAGGQYSYFNPGVYSVTVCVKDKDDGVGCDSLVLNVEPLPITIDIKPGSDTNSVNLGSGGSTSVAIFSTSTFDATTLDPLTLSLANATVQLRGRGNPQTAVEDVNGDGLRDLVVHVTTDAMQLTSIETQAVLTGWTYNGLHVRGADSVRIIREDTTSASSNTSSQSEPTTTPTLEPIVMPTQTPVPVDSDGDGFTDEIDACPSESDTGYGLDISGCPPAPPDSDGDTITDNIDLCPQEPATGGSADGCPLVPTTTPTEAVSVTPEETITPE